ASSWGACSEMHEGARVDRDGAGLQRLRQLALEVDYEQAIAHRRAGHLDVVGEVELPLEGPAGDAAVEIGRTVAVLHLAADEQPVVLEHDLDVVSGEAGKSQDDA